MCVSGLQDVIAQEVVEKQGKPACGGERKGKPEVSQRGEFQACGTLLLEPSFVSVLGIFLGSHTALFPLAKQ